MQNMLMHSPCKNKYVYTYEYKGQAELCHAEDREHCAAQRTIALHAVCSAEDKENCAAQRTENIVQHRGQGVSYSAYDRDLSVLFDSHSN